MKKLLILAAMVAAGSFASASTLYWQLDQSEATTGYGTWDYAVLMGTNGQLNNSGTAISGIEKGDLTSDVIDSSVLSSYNSFYVELWNEGDSERLAATDFVSSGTLASFVYDGGMSTPTTYTFSGFQTGVVPEPSSALLVLIGAMALGLKRKKTV